MPSTDTSSIDEAADALGPSFPRLRITRGAGRSAFHVQHRQSESGPIAYARMAVGGELITAGQYPDHIAIGGGIADRWRSVTASRLWRATSRAIVEALTRPQLRRDVVHEPTVRTMLSCFALTADDGSPSGAHYLPRAVERATAFVDEHLAEPLTVSMIAEAARMSVRGIQVAFRRELGMSPIGHLRRARLRAAHADLVRLDPSTTTVAQIARRWGFEHPPRFAQQYREVFGHNPAETLRR